MRNTHTHSVPRDTQGGRNLVQGSDAILTPVGTARPLNNILGCEHREDAVGSGGAGNVKHTHTRTRTHTHIVPRDTQDAWSLGQVSDTILTHGSVDRPLIKLLGYERREDAVESGGSRQWQTHTNTHTHTRSVTRDTQGGYSLGQGSDAILTIVSVARPLMKVMGYEH